MATRRQHVKFDDKDYKQKDYTELQPVRRWKSARRCANQFIDVETLVDGDESGDEKPTTKMMTWMDLL